MPCISLWCVTCQHLLCCGSSAIHGNIKELCLLMSCLFPLSSSICACQPLPAQSQSACALGPSEPLDQGQGIPFPWPCTWQPTAGLLHQHGLFTVQDKERPGECCLLPPFQALVLPFIFCCCSFLFDHSQHVHGDSRTLYQLHSKSPLIICFAKPLLYSFKSHGGRAGTDIFIPTL